MAGTVMPSPIRVEENETENIARIKEIKAERGDSLIILAHHYQRLGVHQCGDVVGDSYHLCKAAAHTEKARDIVFCGVRFMVTSAAVLCRDDQVVYHPDRNAGCPMADMANLPQVRTSWKELGEVTETAKVIPVVYMNSDLDLKAFCGEHGGIVCTSSNAAKVFDWVFERGEKIFFFPDEHLGRNTANKYGFKGEDIVLWDPKQPFGGLTEAQIQRAKVILWKGFCSVHARFSVEQIEQARRDFPDVQVIVHPECRREVVAASDANGSTEFIIDTIRDAPSGTTWAVGTEINLVNRLNDEMPDKTIFCLDPVICPCSTMYRVHPAYVLWTLEHLVAGEVVNRITVDEATRKDALVALDRMLEVP